MKKFLIASLLTAALFLGVASVASASGGYCQTDRCHVVHYGETLFSIGRQYDVHPYHIAEANNLYNPNHIYAGQVLYIPHGSSYPWGAGCGYNDCGGYGHGYQKSSWHQGSNCGWNDCYEKPSHRPDKCDWNDCYEKPVHLPEKCGWNDCYEKPSHRPDNCGSGCTSGYYGYDFTGYFYGSFNPHQKQYSHTCGYNSNCW
ncbi:MAG: LysM peptidoglycan-binding domain-containing protein [Anaerolineae bacterium]|nr:LysM peptidoglycan-binding domain-containing protein [Anaerolineae bacterium]